MAIPTHLNRGSHPKDTYMWETLEQHPPGDKRYLVSGLGVLIESMQESLRRWWTRRERTKTKNDDAIMFGSRGSARNVRHYAYHSNITSTSRQNLPREPNAGIKAQDIVPLNGPPGNAWTQRPDIHHNVFRVRRTRMDSRQRHDPLRNVLYPVSLQTCVHRLVGFLPVFLPRKK